MAGSVDGQVLNQRDGQPIDGASLQLMPEGGGLKSGSDGKFSFTGLAAGDDYELTVSKDGFQPGVYGPLVVIDEMDPMSLIVALQPSDI